VNRTVEVWVTLGNPDGKWRANGAAQVTVAAVTKPNVVVIPASAVTLEASNADEGVVMVVDEKSVAHETKVKVGVRMPDKVEITSGLKGGEAIVVEGNYALPDGAKVEVSEDKKEEPEGADSEEKKKEP
jgi:multidrug efflux pump subunit AcrA (membrane-fusion protein)